MRIRRAKLLDDQVPLKPIPINGLGEMHSGIEALVDAVNGLNSRLKQIETRLIALERKPDGWRNRVTKRNSEGRITETVIRPIYDAPKRNEVVN